MCVCVCVREYAYECFFLNLFFFFASYDLTKVVISSTLTLWKNTTGCSQAVFSLFFFFLITIFY